MRPAGPSRTDTQKSARSAPWTGVRRALPSRTPKATPRRAIRYTAVRSEKYKDGLTIRAVTRDRFSTCMNARFDRTSAPRPSRGDRRRAVRAPGGSRHTRSRPGQASSPSHLHSTEIIHDLEEHGASQAELAHEFGKPGAYADRFPRRPAPRSPGDREHDSIDGPDGDPDHADDHVPRRDERHGGPHEQRRLDEQSHQGRNSDRCLG